MLAALLGVSAPALARQPDGISNAAAVEALLADPQLVISRESLIASMREPETRPGDVVSSFSSTVPQTSGGAQKAAPDHPTSAASSTAGRVEARNRPLLVETALTAASSALEDVTTRTQPASQRSQQQEQQAEQQGGQQELRASAEPQPQVAALADSQSAARPANKTAAKAAARAAQRHPDTYPGSAEDDEEDEDEDDVELGGASGDLPVRWLDCKVTGPLASISGARVHEKACTASSRVHLHGSECLNLMQAASPLFKRDSSGCDLVAQHVSASAHTSILDLQVHIPL